jgi:hypothetical protein
MIRTWGDKAVLLGVSNGILALVGFSEGQQRWANAQTTKQIPYA